MSLERYQTELSNVRAAIDDLTAGRIQQYRTTTGQFVSRINLSVLYQRETELLRRIGRARRGRFGHVRRGVPR